MNRQKAGPGFTFVELVVVMGILTVLLLFAVPMFSGGSFFSTPDLEVPGLVNLMQSLKQNAVARDRDYFLHIEPNTGRIWVSDASMDDDSRVQARDKSQAVDSDIDIIGVETMDSPGASSEPARLRFSRYGYSDRALVHLRQDGEYITLKLPVFLPGVELIHGVVSYDDCI